MNSDAAEARASRAAQSEYQQLPEYLAHFNEAAVMLATAFITATIILSLVLALAHANGDTDVLTDIPVGDLYTGRYTDPWWRRNNTGPSVSSGR